MKLFLKASSLIEFYLFNFFICDPQKLVIYTLNFNNETLRNNKMHVLTTEAFSVSITTSVGCEKQIFEHSIQFRRRKINKLENLQQFYLFFRK